MDRANLFFGGAACLCSFGVLFGIIGAVVLATGHDAEDSDYTRQVVPEIETVRNSDQSWCLLKQDTTKTPQCQELEVCVRAFKSERVGNQGGRTSCKEKETRVACSCPMRFESNSSSGRMGSAQVFTGWNKRGGRTNQALCDELLANATSTTPTQPVTDAPAGPAAAQPESAPPGSAASTRGFKAGLGLGRWRVGTPRERVHGLYPPA